MPRNDVVGDNPSLLPVSRQQMDMPLDSASRESCHDEASLRHQIGRCTAHEDRKAAPRAAVIACHSEDDHICIVWEAGVRNIGSSGENRADITTP